ncbi:hypothetical protein M885DRAFT_573222 [Pelagophyceae sp. CCMP2097]|nr:hypothetical protein M885DRAFT_573222 [Pelagophyceae sp. CCMP2097]
MHRTLITAFFATATRGAASAASAAAAAAAAAPASTVQAAGATARATTGADVPVGAAGAAATGDAPISASRSALTPAAANSLANRLAVAAPRAANGGILALQDAGGADTGAAAPRAFFLRRVTVNLLEVTSTAYDAALAGPRVLTFDSNDCDVIEASHGRPIFYLLGVRKLFFGCAPISAGAFNDAGKVTCRLLTGEFAEAARNVRCAENPQSIIDFLVALPDPEVQIAYTEAITAQDPLPQGSVDMLAQNIGIITLSRLISAENFGSVDSAGKLAARVYAMLRIPRIMFAPPALPPAPTTPIEAPLVLQAAAPSSLAPGSRELAPVLPLAPAFSKGCEAPRPDASAQLQSRRTTTATGGSELAEVLFNTRSVTDFTHGMKKSIQENWDSIGRVGALAPELQITVTKALSKNSDAVPCLVYDLLAPAFADARLDWAAYHIIAVAKLLAIVETHTNMGIHYRINDLATFFLTEVAAHVSLCAAMPARGSYIVRGDGRPSAGAAAAFTSQIASAAFATKAVNDALRAAAHDTAYVARDLGADGGKRAGKAGGYGGERDKRSKKRRAAGDDWGQSARRRLLFLV